jgi:soluble lytic murein transglycosylase-like protein
MRSVYALIPAALVAGTVLSVSAEAKRVDDPDVHARRVIAQHEYYKARSKRVTRAAFTRKTVRTTNALSRKSKTVASAKPRKLASVRKHKIAPVAPEIARTEPQIARAESKMARAEPKLVRAAAKIVRSEQAAKAPALTQTLESFASMSMTKTLRSGPRDIVQPIAPGAMASIYRIKPNESNSTAFVADIIRELAPSYGVPTWFALRIANVESGYNPYVRGRAGEIGVYQLKCDTARGMGFTGECSQLVDARTNVRWGLKHLSLAIASSGGNLQLAASKHNGGLGRKSLVLSYVAKVF